MHTTFGTKTHNHFIMARAGLSSITLNEIRVQVCIDYEPTGGDPYDVEGVAFKNITDPRCRKLYEAGYGCQGVAHFIFEIDHFPTDAEVEELKQVVKQGIIDARKDNPVYYD